MHKECTIKILLIGSNPSNSSPDSSPFHPNTKSRKFIDKIFAGFSVELHYSNLFDYKTENNKPISKKELILNIEHIKQKFNNFPNTKIIALGRTSSDGLRLAGIDHFHLPHPSGLCRFWNDPVSAEVKIRDMLIWLGL
jgi:hypothetical protein